MNDASTKVYSARLVFAKAEFRRQFETAARLHPEIYGSETDGGWAFPTDPRKRGSIVHNALNLFRCDVLNVKRAPGFNSR